MQRLKGQSALVTGSSSGIGKAIALAMAKEGANVLINYHKHEEEAHNIAKEAQSYGVKTIVVQADTSKEEEVQMMFAKAVEAFGTIDILVNNAGIQKDNKLINMSLKDWELVISLNLTGYFLCAREAAKEFYKRGIVEERSCALGKIVFISSVHEIIPWAGHCNYAAAKGGVMLFMKTIAQELAPDKIRINSIAPGAIKTAINTEAWTDPKQKEELLKLIPYARIGNPEDIGKAAVWLASDESDYVNGETLVVDGGMTLYPGFAHGG